VESLPDESDRHIPRSEVLGVGGDQKVENFVHMADLSLLRGDRVLNNSNADKRESLFQREKSFPGTNE
jgi:hypothetical protein